MAAGCCAEATWTEEEALALCSTQMRPASQRLSMWTVLTRRSIAGSSIAGDCGARLATASATSMVRSNPREAAAWASRPALSAPPRRRAAAHRPGLARRPCSQSVCTAFHFMQPSSVVQVSRGVTAMASEQGADHPACKVSARRRRPCPPVSRGLLHREGLHQPEDWSNTACHFQSTGGTM